MPIETIIYYILPLSITDSFNTTSYQRPMQLGKVFKLFILTYVDSNIPNEIEKFVTVQRFPMKKSFFSVIFFYVWCIKKIVFNVKLGEKNLIYVFFNFISFIIGVSVNLLSLKRVKCVADIWDEPDKQYQILRNTKNSRPSFFVYCFYFIKLSIVNTLFRLLLSKVDLVICSLIEGALDRYGLNPEKVFYVTNGVDLKRTKIFKFIQKKENTFNLLYLGPIAESRLIEDMCKAVHTLRPSIKGLTLTMAGPIYFNSDRKWFKKIVEKYFVNGNILYLGQIPHKQALSLIVEADICLCPLENQRHYDVTFPIKIFEYQSMNKPVIASSLTGIRQVIRHKENGFLIEPGNIKSMIEAIQYLYENPSLCKYMVENAKKEINKYDWDIIHQKIIFRILEL